MICWFTFILSSRIWNFTYFLGIKIDRTWFLEALLSRPFLQNSKICRIYIFLFSVDSVVLYTKLYTIETNIFVEYSSHVYLENVLQFICLKYYYFYISCIIYTLKDFHIVVLVFSHLLWIFKVLIILMQRYLKPNGKF